MPPRGANAAVLADRGFAVLTGDAGVGKSTALRAVWETLSPNQHRPLDLPASDDWTPRPCYRRLAHLLGTPPTRFPEATEHQVRDTPWTLATRQGRQPALAVDEAHLFPPRLLQKLRFLLNEQPDGTAPVRSSSVGTSRCDPSGRCARSTRGASG